MVMGLYGYALEQYVQWKYGAAGALTLSLIIFGYRTKSTACTAIGLTALALLLAQ